MPFFRRNRPWRKPREVEPAWCLRHRIPYLGYQAGSTLVTEVCMLSSNSQHIERVASELNEHVENDDSCADKAPNLKRHELEVIFA